MDMKYCSASENCLHPNGPLLPLSEFNKDTGKKDGLSSRCKVCRYAVIKAWQQAHKKRMHEYGKAYRAIHPEKNRERRRRWRRNHPDKVRAENRRNRLNNPEKMHRAESQWRKAHPEYARQREQKRRAHKRRLPTTFGENDWLCALTYWHGCCAYCGNPPALWDNPRILHQDHFVPLSKNGPYTPENILPACQSCNLGKHNSDPVEWLTERFGKRKAKQILKAIQKYFDWIKSHG